jgi:predicted ATP-grasp superfamily ATP-dependent carboligase
MSAAALFSLRDSPATMSEWFADRVVVTPCLTVANAGQAACEALLTHLKLERVGAVDHDALVPVTYAINGGADVALACEVYHSPVCRATVVQRRAPTRAVRGAARRFATDLVGTLRGGGARALVLAAGIDHGSLSNAHRRPLVFCSGDVDAELAARLASLPALAVTDIAIVSGESTFSRFAFAAAAACGLPLVILAVPVAEGVDEIEQIHPLVKMLQAVVLQQKHE